MKLLQTVLILMLVWSLQIYLEADSFSRFLHYMVKKKKKKSILNEMFKLLCHFPNKILKDFFPTQMTTFSITLSLSFSNFLFWFYNSSFPGMGISVLISSLNSSVGPMMQSALPQFQFLNSSATLFLIPFSFFIHLQNTKAFSSSHKKHSSFSLRILSLPPALCHTDRSQFYCPSLSSTVPSIYLPLVYSIGAALCKGSLMTFV